MTEAKKLWAINYLSRLLSGLNDGSINITSLSCGGEPITWGHPPTSREAYEYFINISFIKDGVPNVPCQSDPV